MTAEVEAEIEKDGNVLIIKRIHATYTLKVAPEQRATVERVHGFHAEFCPVARSLSGSIDISTELRMIDLD